MYNPLLFLEYPELNSTDFDKDVPKICFMAVHNLYEQGARKLSPYEVDQEIEKHESLAIRYKADGGLDFLKRAYEFAEEKNFDLYYNRLKKYSLLRRLKKNKYDISSFYLDDKDIDDPLKAIEIQKHFEESSLEDILNEVEKNYTIIRNEYLNGGRTRGDPASDIIPLIDKLKLTPDSGPTIEGEIFNMACRGARPGCFYLKSASTSAGKTRTAVFDACRLAYPERWNYEVGTFIEDVDMTTGEILSPRKVLFIVTEMDKEELQTIMLAYLSGVNEDHILRGAYDGFEEEWRVRYAAKIIEKYSGYFIIEEISDPNLVNVEATIKKYVMIDKIKYVFFDYIHTTASMVSQFAKNNLGEHTILMMMANQLKQIAKDNNICIFSSTQVNATAMTDDMEFKNETCIRGSKSVADKVDIGYVMSKIGVKTWNSMKKILQPAAISGKIDRKYILDDNYKPTHILDIYKMRRGRFKNVRIWCHLDLGTGRRQDLFMTTSDNQVIDLDITGYNKVGIIRVNNWKDAVQ